MGRRHLTKRGGFRQIPDGTGGGYSLAPPRCSVLKSGFLLALHSSSGGRSGSCGVVWIGCAGAGVGLLVC
jgi:hypothetical protein